MYLLSIIKSRRTVRKYTQEPISKEVLTELVDCARLAPSGQNLQPLEFLLITEQPHLESVFQNIGFAGYIAPHGTPKEGEKPTAYVIVLVKEKESPMAEIDAAAAIENLLIAANALHIGSCWMRNIKRSNLRSLFSIPDEYIISAVVALGYPMEENVTEPYRGDVKYYKDDKGNYHVPKRELTDILHINQF